MATEETNNLKRIHNGIQRFVRLFRNNVGLFRALDSERKIRCGLIVGSGDLIGWSTIEITPEMVGKRVAVFTSIEVKKFKGKNQQEQLNWRNQVIEQGGIAGTAVTPEEARQIIENYISKLRDDEDEI